MNETILIATNRKTGKDVLLAGREVSYPKQRDMYREFTGPVHEEYSNVGLYYVQPCKKPLKLITKAEHSKRSEEHKQLVAASEVEVKADKKKSGKDSKKEAATSEETKPETK